MSKPLSERQLCRSLPVREKDPFWPHLATRGQPTRVDVNRLPRLTRDRHAIRTISGVCCQRKRTSSGIFPRSNPLRLAIECQVGLALVLFADMQAEAVSQILLDTPRWDL